MYQCYVCGGLAGCDGETKCGTCLFRWRSPKIKARILSALLEEAQSNVVDETGDGSFLCFYSTGAYQLDTERNGCTKGDKVVPELFDERVIKLLETSDNGEARST